MLDKMSRDQMIFAVMEDVPTRVIEQLLVKGGLAKYADNVLDGWMDGDEPDDLLYALANNPEYGVVAREAPDDTQAD